MSLPWPMAVVVGGGGNQRMRSPIFRPLCSPFPPACLGSSPTHHFLAMGALGKTLTFLSLTFCVCEVQIVKYRIKLDSARQMVSLLPSLHVKEVGSSMPVLASALPLTCCVFLGTFLLSGPKSLHVSCSLVCLLQKSLAQNPQTLGRTSYIIYRASCS